MIVKQTGFQNEGMTVWTDVIWDLLWMNAIWDLLITEANTREGKKYL